MNAGGPAPSAPGGPEVQAQALELASRALAALSGGRSADGRLFVPGRIEVLGKHTDYAGGRSLTFAAERGFTVAWRGRRDDRVRMLDARDGRTMECALDLGIEPVAGHWSNYPMTVVRRLCRNFPGLGRGADVAFYSTLPKAAGLSTSSALITATVLVIAQANGLMARADFHRLLGDPARLAGYLGSIENGEAFGELPGDHGVGTIGGSEDHTAILLSQAGHIGCYQYHPVRRLASLPLGPALTFVVAASGIAAAKTGSARGRYNHAAALVQQLVARWRREAGRVDETLAAALDSAPGAVDRLRSLAGADERSRLDHFLVEDREILPAALKALAPADLSTFGRLVDRSQRAAEELLGNQVPETITLARLARELGAHAASSFGAGFGGSVWALVDKDGAGAFLAAWSSKYTEVHPQAAQRAEFFVTRPGPGALPLV